jgi:hypothetical protein
MPGFFLVHTQGPSPNPAHPNLTSVASAWMKQSYVDLPSWHTDSRYDGLMSTIIIPTKSWEFEWSIPSKCQWAVEEFELMFFPSKSVETPTACDHVQFPNTEIINLIPSTICPLPNAQCPHQLNPLKARLVQGRMAEVAIRHLSLLKPLLRAIPTTALRTWRRDPNRVLYSPPCIPAGIRRIPGIPGEWNFSSGAC